MILYHGSNVEVKNPKIINTEIGKDFGPAFYLTPIKEQAERMAVRKVRFEKTGKPIVSVFNFDEKIENFNFKKYIKPNKEWLEMIIQCRTDPKFKHGFDIVEGKIADDSVGATISYVIEGIMRKEDAITKLKFQHINSQIAFCTEASLSCLTFIESYEIKNG